jgi:hypothetical protein
MSPQETLHLLLFLQTQQRKTMPERVEDDLGILVDGRIDDAFAEEEVLLRKEVQ